MVKKLAITSALIVAFQLIVTYLVGGYTPILGGSLGMILWILAILGEIAIWIIASIAEIKISWQDRYKERLLIVILFLMTQVIFFTLIGPNLLLK